MSDSQDQNPPKENLYTRLAKLKSEAQRPGCGSGGFGKKSASRFPRPEKAQALPPRGGRNGNGKPS